MKYRIVQLMVLALILVSCGKPLPQLDNLDLEKWKNDKFACGHEREKMRESLTAQIEKLKGLSQDDIVKLLGRPDENELYKRNQKFFYYYITPGKKCEQDTISQKLSLRFNAMGFAKEVLIE
ncbi:MAG: hypothetical protein ACK5RG_15280 [Cyclobacteriaceae bacterium]